MDEDSVYLCALNRIFCFRPAAGRRLMEHYGVRGLFSLGKKELSELFGGDEKYVSLFLEDTILEWSRKEVEWAAGKGVQLIPIGSGHYPVLLSECGDAPLMLYCYGTLEPGNTNMISIVGTRLATGYGRECCDSIISSLEGSDAVIVSGLAFGIDVAAHKKALEYGLKSVAVMPCGIDMVYPQAHREIAAGIAKQGAVITEFSTGTKPLRIHFIKRNRIIAGLSKCTIVVESRIRGGAMSTVQFALSYNRDVYAVPGRICDINSSGCNYLISKNMASIYNGIEDGFAKTPDLFSGTGGEKEKILLTLKNNSATDIDSICRKSGLDFPTVSALLLELELEGKIVSLQGNNYKLT